jgi:hypothetical protein
LAWVLAVEGLAPYLWFDAGVVREDDGELAETIAVSVQSAPPLNLPWGCEVKPAPEADEGHLPATGSES